MNFVELTFFLFMIGAGLVCSLWGGHYLGIAGYIAGAFSPAGLVFALLNLRFRKPPSQ